MDIVMPTAENLLFVLSVLSSSSSSSDLHNSLAAEVSLPYPCHRLAVAVSADFDGCYRTNNARVQLRVHRKPSVAPTCSIGQLECSRVQLGSKMTLLCQIEAR